MPGRSIQDGVRSMLDLIYLAGGVALLLIFAGYAALLKRA